MAVVYFNLFGRLDVLQFFYHLGFKLHHILSGFLFINFLLQRFWLFVAT